MYPLTHARSRAHTHTHDNKCSRPFGHKTRVSSRCNNNCDFEVAEIARGGELQDKGEKMPECSIPHGHRGHAERLRELREGQQAHSRHFIRNGRDHCLETLGRVVSVVNER